MKSSDPLFARALVIQPLRWGDLAFADRLRARVGWNHQRVDWDRFVAGSFGAAAGYLATWRGRPAGVVTIIGYGNVLGWIGMLLVARSFRRHGIGSALLIHAQRALQQRCFPCVKLDATPLGQGLYERHGFTAEWLITRGESSGVGGAARRGAARAVRADDWSAIAALDRRAFGADRESLLRDFQLSGARFVCVFQARDLVGYGCLRRGSRAWYLGPVVARTAPAAESIVFGLLGQIGGAQPVYWDMPHPNGHALRLAEQLGFKPQRRLLRMRSGRTDSLSDPKLMYAIADPALG